MGLAGSEAYNQHFMKYPSKQNTVKTVQGSTQTKWKEIGYAHSVVQLPK